MSQTVTLSLTPAIQATYTPAAAVREQVAKINQELLDIAIGGDTTSSVTIIESMPLRTQLVAIFGGSYNVSSEEFTGLTVALKDTESASAPISFGPIEIPDNAAISPQVLANARRVNAINKTIESINYMLGNHDPMEPPVANFNVGQLDKYQLAIVKNAFAQYDVSMNGDIMTVEMKAAS